MVNFQIHIFHRMLALSLFLLMVFDLGFELFNYSEDASFFLFFKDNLFIIIMSIVGLFLAASFLKYRYQIKENKIVVKDFLRKNRSYQISEILDIEIKELIGPVAYIRIYFKDNKKLTIPIIENQDYFLMLIKSA